MRIFFYFQVIEGDDSMTKEKKVNATCEIAGCFGVIPTYELSDASLRELIERSSSCRQFIKVSILGYCHLTIKGHRQCVELGSNCMKQTLSRNRYSFPLTYTAMLLNEKYRTYRATQFISKLH